MRSSFGSEYGKVYFIEQGNAFPVFINVENFLTR